ncbi:MAG: hypothetical protein ABI972_28810, partial [Acidobacteriota bacterium]
LRWLWMLAPVMAAGLALVFILNRPEPHRTFETASVKTQQATVPAPPPTESRTSGSAAASSSPAPAGPVPQFAKSRSLPAQQPPPPPPPPPAALELQVERSSNGRFESTELGALRQGDRVRFRVRVPEPGTLVMTAGANVARSTLAEPGRTYYLPDANGLPPGDAPLQVAIALHPNIEGERGNTLFRARQAAADKPAASALGGAAPAAAPPPAAPMRDTRREDSAKAKEQAAPKQEAAVGRLSQSANQVAPPSSPRTVVLNLEFKPR